jgi:hypothetical protein
MQTALSFYSCEPLESRTLLATHGLNATYFDALDFAGHSVQRIDPNINFDWGDHRRPAPGIRGNTFSVRWDGMLKTRAAGDYTFSFYHNDGAQMWLGAAGQLFSSMIIRPRTTHSATVTLKANTFYDIRVEYFDKDRTAAVQLNWSGPGFSTEFVPSGRLFAYDMRFAVIGDYGRTNSYAHGTARVATKFAPDFIVTVGDNNYDSGSADTIDPNVGESYHWFIGNYQGNFGGGPKQNHFFPAIGNHDWTPHGSIAPYKDYFTLPGNERYYDFVQGDIHFFVLDSDVHEPDGVKSDSKQAKWLKAALAGSTSLYNVVYFHHAPYASGDHGDSGWMQWPFKDWGADVVLSGHDHEYERLIEGGLTYVVDGAGAGPTEFGNSFRAGSVARNDTDSGALLVQANDLAMTFEYQLSGGEIVDTFTIPAGA